MSLEKQEKGTRNSSTQCPNLLTGKTIVFLRLTLKLTEVVTYRQSFSWDYSRMNDNIHQPKTFIAFFVIETCVLTMSCMYTKNIHGRRRTETFRSQIGKGWVLISPFGNVFYLFSFSLHDFTITLFAIYQMDVTFSCICPVIAAGLRHNILEVVMDLRGNSRVDPQTIFTMLCWKSLSITVQTRENLTSIFGAFHKLRIHGLSAY